MTTPRHPRLRSLGLILMAAVLGVACNTSTGGGSAGAGSPGATAPGGSASASAAESPAAPSPGGSLGPPQATPLAQPPEEPASDGTTATITTDLGPITVELFTESSPVAAENFINLAEAGFYEGVVFHRIVPEFVIQGGDPEGNGTGGPGYTIEDEPVVGDYGRGILAMARTPQPNSQGSQFFIVLSDEAAPALEQFRTYAIFGRVTEGMEVVDQIAAGPRGGGNDDVALQPVAMTSVTVQRP